MEMIDILNSDGSQTGNKASKKEVHEKGLWHGAVHVWFVNSSGEILLQKRADDLESHPGEYDISAAGHLSAGDTYIRGALREVEEELGIKLDEKELVKIGEIHHESTQRAGKHINKEYNNIYVVHTDLPISAFSIQESEVSEIKYISVDELKRWVSEKREGLANTPKRSKNIIAVFGGRVKVFLRDALCAEFRASELQPPGLLLGQQSHVLDAVLARRVWECYAIWKPDVQMGPLDCRATLAIPIKGRSQEMRRF